MASYPYIKITIEEFQAPKEGDRYPERTELATQIIHREWFFSHEMLQRIMAVIYGLEVPEKPTWDEIADGLNHD